MYWFFSFWNYLLYLTHYHVSYFSCFRCKYCKLDSKHKACLSTKPWYICDWLVACSVPCHVMSMTGHTVRVSLRKDLIPHTKNTNDFNSVFGSAGTAKFWSQLILKIPSLKYCAVLKHVNFLQLFKILHLKKRAGLMKKV